MNPYDFVRVDWSRPPSRTPYTPHDRFTGWTGYLDCRLTVETPLFIPKPRTAGASVVSGPKDFITNGTKTPVVPGSSLKGLVRSLVETLGPGCWKLYDGQYKDRDKYGDDKPIPLPSLFRPCMDNQRLCPACRMFGLVSGNEASLLGKVGIDDALCEEARPHAAVFTPILGGPKPRHTVWYTDLEGRPAGRKYYFHHTQIQTENALRKTKGDVVINEHIKPLDQGTVFTFRVHFSNMADDELALLVYALALEPAMRHKLGFAKPAGFGSVRVMVQSLRRQKMADRYRGVGPEQLSGDALDRLVDELKVQATRSIAPVTLGDLRRIWRWPPVGTYRFPSQDWFRDYPTTPISETP